MKSDDEWTEVERDQKWRKDLDFLLRLQNQERVIHY